MDSANYELDLPRENIHIRCFAHNIMNYRYHWHVDDYELSILLYGVQSYCRGSENSLPEDLERRAIARRLLEYVEEHYTSKLTLEDLADYAQYNRTYVSTLFKQIVGINFHEYLTRVRFQHALNDLAITNDNLTDIALRNGFADLKTFNARFRATLQRTPAEYRASLSPDRVVDGMTRRFLAPDDPILQKKLAEYTHIGML